MQGMRDLLWVSIRTPSAPSIVDHASLREVAIHGARTWYGYIGIVIPTLDGRYLALLLTWPTFLEFSHTRYSSRSYICFKNLWSRSPRLCILFPVFTISYVDNLSCLAVRLFYGLLISCYIYDEAAKLSFCNS